MDDIIFFAFRYCLGRRTYAVSMMVDYLLENWSNLPKNIRDKIKKEIEGAIKNDEAGADYDIEKWRKILNK